MKKREKKNKDNRLNIDDIEKDVSKIKCSGPGILAQMEAASTVSYDNILNSENMYEIMKEMFKSMPSSFHGTTSYNSNTSKYFWDFGKEEPKVEEKIIKTGVISQMIFGEEGYEIKDGEIIRTLTIEEINKLKNE